MFGGGDFEAVLQPDGQAQGEHDQRFAGVVLPGGLFVFGLLVEDFVEGHGSGQWLVVAFSCQFLLGDARQFVGQFPVFVQLFGVHAERGLDRLSFGDEGVEARGVGLLQRG